MDGLTRGLGVMAASRMMLGACEEAGIPYEIFEESIVVQYRALKLARPEKIAEIERLCDEVDLDMAALKRTHPQLEV